MTTSTYTNAARWNDALAAFVVTQNAAARTQSTIDRRVKQIRRFALETDLNPWHATYEDVRGWLDNLRVERSTRMAYRDSLRAFYRWAIESRRVDVDPTEEPSQRARRLTASPTWETELAAFRASLRATGRPESTVNVRMSQLRRFARENASLDPFDVTLDDMLEWMGTKQRWALETRRTQRSAFRSFYAWAKSTGRIRKNPAAKLPVVAKGQPHARPALDSDYASALAKASKRERLALRLAAELGMRCAEVAAVHVRDVSGSAGAWSLTVHGKGNKRRTLPIADDLAGPLRDFEGFVFVGNWDGHLSPHYLGKLVSGLLPPGVTMHMLRHRFATMAYNVDRDVFSVQQLLGHASPATTQGYVQVSDSSLRRLVYSVSGKAGA